MLVAGPGYTPSLYPDVVVTAARQTQLLVALDRAPMFSEEVVVQASAFSRPPDVATGTHTLSFEEIRRAPGGLGDVSRLMQSLPGVVVSSDQRNDIVARGGSPTEALMLVDGIEVPNINHFASQGASGGPIGMLNNELIQSATFLAGGFPAVYGDRLSAVLDLTLRQGSREKFEADVDLGFAGVGLLAEGPLGSRGSFVMSARRSYLELLASSFGLTAIPRFANFQGKAVVDLSPRHRLSFLSLGGTDSIHVDVDPDDREDPSLLDIRSSGWRTTHGLVWRGLLGTRGIGTMSLSQGVSTFTQSVRDLQIGNQVIFDQDSRETLTTARYDLTYPTRRLGALRAGVLGRSVGARMRIAQPIGTDNPFSVDTARVDATAIQSDVHTGQGSGYLQTTIPVGGRLDVTAGARMDHFAFIDATTLTPRLAVVARIRPTVDLNASYGRYTQVPGLVFLAADPTNRHLRPMRAEHRVLGIEWRPTPGLRLTLEGYDKRYRDYPVSADYETLSLANTGDFYGPAGLLMPLVSRGYGRARGVEVFVQQKLTRAMYGQLAYSYSRTRHAAGDGILRPGGFDTPHVLALVGGRRFNERFELSTKLTLASGRPTTPFLPEPSREQNRAIFDLSRVNAERGPSYQRWDVRMDRRAQFSWTTLVTWMEVQNLLGRKNVYQHVWNPKIREREPLHQIGRFIVGGFTFEF